MEPPNKLFGTVSGAQIGAGGHERRDLSMDLKKEKVAIIAGGPYSEICRAEGA